MAGLSLRDLEAVHLLADRKNFRAAAAELGISASALSHVINSVERRVGVRLFNRTTRSVGLTQAGAAFVDRVRPGLIAINDALEMADEFRSTPSGLVRINASQGAAERLLPLVLDFMEEYPQVRVEIVTEGQFVDIVAKGFDAGVRLAEAVAQDMIAIPFGTDERFVIVASPTYLEKNPPPLSPSDLSRHTCIRSLMPSGKILRWELERHGQVVVPEISGRLVLGSSGLASQAALSGAGLAYADAWSVEQHVAAGRLSLVLADWTPSFPGHRLYFPRQRLPSAAFRAFLNYLQAQRSRIARPSA